MKLDGKITIVTGAASGIGEAIARRFRAEGAHVLISDVDREGLARVAAETGAVAEPADVSRERDILRVIDRAERELGAIDLFFSNAGIGIRGGAEVDDEGWQRIWLINLMAHVWAARALLPKMLARGGGYLCSTASAAGLLSQIGSAPYAVTKHAAVAFAEWLAITHGAEGLRVSVLCPQAVRTKMTAPNQGGVAALDGMLEPEEVAGEVVRAIEAERFLILPHPQVQTYMQRKANDIDRWLSGMQRLKQRMIDSNRPF